MRVIVSTFANVEDSPANDMIGNATQTTNIATAHTSSASKLPAAPPTPSTTTPPVSPADSGHRSLLGPVVGGTVGGMSLIVLGFCLWLFIRWRKKRLAESRLREKLAQSPEDSLPETRETHEAPSLSNGHAGSQTRKIVVSTIPNPFLDYQRQTRYDQSSSIYSTDLASTSIRATVNSSSFRTQTDTDGEELWDQRTSSTTTYSDPFDLERPPSIVGG